MLVENKVFRLEIHLVEWMLPQNLFSALVYNSTRNTVKHMSRDKGDKYRVSVELLW